MERKRLIAAAVAICLAAGNLPAQNFRTHPAALTKGVAQTISNRSFTTSQNKESTSPFASASERGRHHIQLSIGLLTAYGVESEISNQGLVNIVGGDGFIGSIAYRYWVKHDLAIGVTVGFLGSEINTSISGSEVAVETSSVVPALFGIKYQPATMRLSEDVRPYLLASVGPWIGSGTRTRTGTRFVNETYSETTLGSHFALGTDFVISRLFAAGVSVGYYLATDFDRAIGPQKNYSSPEFSLLFTIAFGKGR